MADTLPFLAGWQASQQMTDSAQENKLRKLLLDQKTQELGQQNALAGVIGNTANYDTNGYLKRDALPQIAAAAPGKLPEYQQVFAQQATQQAAARKAALEQHMQTTEIASRVLSSVKDQAGLDQARSYLATIFPEGAATLPTTYDQATIGAIVQRGMSLKDQMDQEYKRLTFGETKRHNQATEETAAANAGKPQVLQTENGPVIIDTRTGLARPAVGLDGKPLPNPKEAQAETGRKKDANDALSLLAQAETLVPASTGSYLGAGIDAGMAAIGKSTEGAKAAAQLKAIEGMLVSKMPKMSGPQSDKDVAMYRQMAGQIGDPTIPRDTKLAAIKTIREIQNKYAGNEAVPAAAPAKAAAGLGQDVAIAELQRRAAADPALAAKLKAMGY